MEHQYEVREIRLLQEVFPCGYVDSALPPVDLETPDMGCW